MGFRERLAAVLVLGGGSLLVGGVGMLAGVGAAVAVAGGFTCLIGVLIGLGED